MGFWACLDAWQGADHNLNIEQVIAFQVLGQFLHGKVAFNQTLNLLPWVLIVCISWEALLEDLFFGYDILRACCGLLFGRDRPLYPHLFLQLLQHCQVFYSFYLYYFLYGLWPRLKLGWQGQMLICLGRHCSSKLLQHRVSRYLFRL